MHKRFAAFSIACLLAMSLQCHAQGDNPEISCSRVAKLEIPEAKIVQSSVVAQGSFVAPGESKPKQQALYRGLPSFCRVIVHAAPSADSDIAIEVWLPAAGWNGKFRGIGNGGFAGSIDYVALGTAVSQGYATASTDTGHVGEGDVALDAKWALGHPEKIVDFGYRAIHLMTADAKIIIQSFYSQPIAHAYFASCSNGGRQALMEAQRFPEDYDGILAGAPAYAWTSLLSGGLNLLQAFDGDGYIPQAKVPVIAHTVIAQCDALDGVRDGIISNPPRCHLNTAPLLCKRTDNDSCLTASQMASLKKIYSGARTVKSDLISPGFSPGGEDGPGGWKDWIIGPGPGKSVGAGFMNGFFRNMVYDDPGWSHQGANLDAAYAYANRKVGSTLNAVDPNLKPFADRGGKLIVYHGWSDPAIPAADSIEYYRRVAAALGPAEAAAFIRLYLVPGMQHCSGGPGPNDFGQSGDSSRADSSHDIYSALEQWVESGTAPTSIIATKYLEDNVEKPVQMARPLCPYPEVVKYKGSGDTNTAVNFYCARPSQP